jgi:hypothetical protein
MMHVHETFDWYARVARFGGNNGESWAHSPNICQRFLRLKAQAPKISNDQVITQAIKALHVGSLHNHLVRERPKTVQELYENFEKFSKSEVLHFRKLEQQRKAPKKMKPPGQLVITEEDQTTLAMIVHRSMLTTLTQMVAVHQKIRRKYLAHLHQNRKRGFDNRKDQYNQRGG